MEVAGVVILSGRIGAAPLHLDLGGLNQWLYYYPAGAKLTDSKIATNGGWPHKYDGTYYYAVSNVLVCTGNGGNNYSINGYTFQDATNGRCEFVYLRHQ